MDSFVGIDWGCEYHQCCVVDEEGRVELELRVRHDAGGIARLDTELGRLGGRLPIAIERAEGLLVEHLVGQAHHVYPVNPRIAARIRERYRVAPVKDDAFDAYTLADGLRHEHAHWRALKPASAELAKLRALVRDRNRLVSEQVRVESQLRMILEAYHPAAASLFSSVDRQITLAFVRDYPTPQQAARIGEQRMRRFLARHSYRGRVSASVLTARLREHLLTASDGTVAGRSITALAFADVLEVLNQQRDQLDRHLAAALARHPDAELFQSFPGVGTITAATLLAEIGEDRDRFPDAGMLLAEAGLAPVTRRSGNTRRVRFRLAANRTLRDAFTWWAYNSLKTSPWARTRYDQGRSRGQRSYRALRGVGSAWARILWRCWQDATPYDPAHHKEHATA
jgi:transposase